MPGGRRLYGGERRGERGPVVVVVLGGEKTTGSSCPLRGAVWERKEREVGWAWPAGVVDGLASPSGWLACLPHFFLFVSLLFFCRKEKKRKGEQVLGIFISQLFLVD